MMTDDKKTMDDLKGMAPIAQARVSYENNLTNEPNTLSQFWGYHSPQHKLLNEIYSEDMLHRNKIDFNTFANSALYQSTKGMTEECEIVSKQIGGGLKEKIVLEQLLNMMGNKSKKIKREDLDSAEFTSGILNSTADLYRKITANQMEEYVVRKISFSGLPKPRKVDDFANAILAHNMLHNANIYNKNNCSLNKLSETAFDIIPYMSELYNLKVKNIKIKELKSRTAPSVNNGFIELVPIEEVIKQYGDL